MVNTFIHVWRNCILSHQTNRENIFEGKSKKLQLVFDFEPKNIRLLAEVIWQCCQICSLGIQTNLRRTKHQFNKHLNLIIFIGFWIFFKFLSNNYSKVLSECNLCPERKILMKRYILRGTVDYEFVFWDWASNFLSFGKTFSNGCKNCVLRVDGNLLRKTLWFTGLLFS